jgi:protein O-mannosyl-transferase
MKEKFSGFVSIIVPTYQEVENIRPLVSRIANSISMLGTQYEVIIVDDDSKDGTDKVVEALSAERYPVSLITRTGERGLSSAVIRGFEEAKGDILICMDADMSHPPEVIPSLLEQLAVSQADCVIGSRYVQGAEIDENWGLFRWLNSKIAKLMARPFTTVKDPMSGFFAVPKRVFKRATQLNPIGYKIGLEIIVKCRCKKVVEVPIHFSNRRFGQSKLNLKEQINYVKHLKRLADFKYSEISRLVRKFWIYVALALTTIAVFYRVCTYDFVNYDDPGYVYKNPDIQNGITPEAIKWAFTNGYACFWHPLTWLSYMLDWQLFGSKAGGYHLTNLIFHIANTLLLFTVLKQMTRRLWPSAFVAALFALHPLHVESVAWIAERKDVLSTFFWMLTMWAYLRYVKHPSVTRYLLALLAFAFGLMAKPMLVTLPFVLLLLDYWPLGRVSFKQRRIYYLIREKFPFIILSAIFSVIVFLTEQSGGALPSLAAVSIKFRIFNVLISYVNYIEKMVWPSRLAIYYPHSDSSISIPYAVISAILLLAVTIFILRFAKKYRYLVTGWFWYLGTLVPVIGLIQIGSFAMADRYTYITLTGLFIIIAWGAPDLLSGWRYKKIVLTLSALLIILAMSICTHFQLRYWRNSITLFQHDLDVTGDNYIAHICIAEPLFEQSRFDEATVHLTEALRLDPNSVRAHYDLGQVLVQKGKVNEAIEHFEKVLQLAPDWVEPMNNLAWLLATSKETAIYNPDKAVVLAKRACELTKYKQPDLLDTLAVAYAAAGDFSKAVETAEKALELCQSSEQNTLKSEIENRLALYKAGKPYIETK